MKLDVNADVVDIQDLANKLVKLINDYFQEYRVMKNEGNPDADYFAGLISAYSSVASMIGVPNDSYYPEVMEIY